MGSSRTMDDRRAGPPGAGLRRLLGAPDVRLALRIAVLFATLLALALLIAFTRAYVAMALMAAAALWQGWALHRHVHRAGEQVARFAEALDQDDFSHHWAGGETDAVQGAVARAVDRVRAARSAQEAEALALRALIERVPVALLVRDAEGRFDPVNTAARKLFGPAAGPIAAERGPDLADALAGIGPGETRLVPMITRGGMVRVKLTASAVVARGETRHILSVENIQTELDSTRLEAWHDLVRVLTHEMMNSLTPVSSLAETVHGLVDDVKDQVARDSAAAGPLTDIQDAVDTIGRRAEGLLRFVQGYRRLTRVPAPTRQRFRLDEVFDRLHRLMAPDLDQRGIAFEAVTEPQDLLLNADPDLLEQALINLVRNAADAMTGQAAPARISLRAALDADEAVVIDVADTGPGIPGDIAERIFVPFFTTKASGSGVGLSIAKQVMAAHGGSLGVRSGGVRSGPGDGDTPCGAVFTLRFP